MLVSVIIPTFNRFPFLLQAIQSVLRQSSDKIKFTVEVFVIDDCSTDQRYLSLPALFASEPRVKIIRNDVNFRTKFQSNHAQGETRNVGLRLAKGDYIAFLDDDDFWLPSKLEKQLTAIKQSAGCQMCSTNAVIGHGLAKTGTYNEIYFKQPLKPFFDLEYILSCNYIMNSSVIISQELFTKTGFQKAEVYEDYEYWKRCLEHTNCCYLPEPLIGYDMSHGYGKQYS